MENLNRLNESWNNITDLVIYGFGRTAERNIDRISQDFNIVGIVDNGKCGMEYHGTHVMKQEEAVEILNKYKIVVVTSSVAYLSIKNNLEKLGLAEYNNFCRLDLFMAEWYWKNKRQIFLSQTFSPVTSRCTFKCRYCNLFMPYYDEEHHYMKTVEDILSDFELYFKMVDYLAAWSILGGEPLLNKNLADIIEAVYRNHGDRIGYIQIISNGSIVPDNHLLETVKRCHVNMRLSDYTHVIAYNKKLNEVKEVLEKNGIPYSMSVYTEWADLGLPFKIEPLHTRGGGIM